MKTPQKKKSSLTRRGKSSDEGAGHQRVDAVLMAWVRRGRRRLGAGTESFEGRRVARDGRRLLTSAFPLAINQLIVLRLVKRKVSRNKSLKGRIFDE